MQTLLKQPALGFGNDDYDVADLVLVGLLDGEWQALRTSVAHGLELEEEHGEAVGAIEVEGALNAFRYRHRLLAAAELRAWLKERELSLRDLQGVLRRTILRERWPERVSTSPPGNPADPSAVMRSEAICSGTLARCAEVLLRWHGAREVLTARGKDDSGAALAVDAEAREALLEGALKDEPSGLPSLGAGELRRRAERLLALRADYRLFESTAVTHATIAARLEERRMEWTSVSGDELAFEREGAALETRLHILHDGRSLAEVGAMVGLTPARRELDLGTAPKEIGGELLAARQGELVGPWREDDRWRVLVLERRVEPQADDERARARAREELLTELVERFSAGKAVHLAAL